MGWGFQGMDGILEMGISEAGQGCQRAFNVFFLHLSLVQEQYISCSF
jgi:hypothetical protein